MGRVQPYAERLFQLNIIKTTGESQGICTIKYKVKKMWGMFKKKADKPTINSMDFKFSCVLDVDSSVGDEELPEYLRGKVKELICDEMLNIIVNRVTRNGQGIIESMDVDFWDNSRTDK